MIQTAPAGPVARENPLAMMHLGKRNFHAVVLSQNRHLESAGKGMNQDQHDGPISLTDPKDRTALKDPASVAQDFPEQVRNADADLIAKMIGPGRIGKNLNIMASRSVNRKVVAEG